MLGSEAPNARSINITRTEKLNGIGEAQVNQFETRVIEIKSESIDRTIGIVMSVHC